MALGIMRRLLEGARNPGPPWLPEFHFLFVSFGISHFGVFFQIFGEILQPFIFSSKLLKSQLEAL